MRFDVNIHEVRLRQNTAEEPVELIAETALTTDQATDLCAALFVLVVRDAKKLDAKIKAFVEAARAANPK